MKRVFQKDTILDVVDTVESLEGTSYICRATKEGERKCSYTQTKYNPSNFKRHLINLHGAVAARLGLAPEAGPSQKKAKTGKLLVATSRKMSFWELCSSPPVKMYRYGFRNGKEHPH